jgi:hypothetical protein
LLQLADLLWGFSRMALCTPLAVGVVVSMVRATPDNSWRRSFFPPLSVIHDPGSRAITHPVSLATFALAAAIGYLAAGIKAYWGYHVPGVAGTLSHQTVVVFFVLRPLFVVVPLAYALRVIRQLEAAAEDEADASEAFDRSLDAGPASGRSFTRRFAAAWPHLRREPLFMFLAVPTTVGLVLSAVLAIAAIVL